MTDEELLRKLLAQEDKLKKRAAFVGELIRIVSARYSKQQGYMVPLTRTTLVQELNK